MNNSSILLGVQQVIMPVHFCLFKTTRQLIESILMSPCRVALQQAMRTMGNTGLGQGLVPPSFVCPFHLVCPFVCPFHLVCPRWCCMHIDFDMLAMGLGCSWPGSLSHNSWWISHMDMLYTKTTRAGTRRAIKARWQASVIAVVACSVHNSCQ